MNTFSLVLCNYVLQFAVDEQQLQLSCTRLYNSLIEGGRLIAFIPSCDRSAVITEEMGKIYGKENKRLHFLRI